MRKGLIVLLAALLVVAFALPAMAEHSMKGFVRVKARVQQNYNGTGPSGLFILPTKDPATASYVEQRQRFIFDWNMENAGARAYFEIDFSAWGDRAYQNGIRNVGAALEGDSINLETKNFYIWFNVPNTSLKFTVGLQNQTDSYDGVIFGVADMAGIFVTGKMEPVSYKLGWAKWQEGSTTVDNDVDLYIAEAKFSPTKEAKLGLNFYLLRDASGEGGPVPGNTNLNSIFDRIGNAYLGAPLGNVTYGPSNFYYVGVDGAIKAGPVDVSGWFFYNFGKIEDPTAGGTDVDLKAWAASLRGDMDLGPGKFFIAGAYVTGTKLDDLAGNDVKTPITGNQYALAGSFPFYKWDTQILFPNGDDINASSALAYDANNYLRGVLAFAAGYKQKFSDMLSGKVGLGYLTDAENFLSGPGSPFKKHKAFEVNANVNYALVKGIDLGLYGAYAFLSDWENFTAAGADPTQDADDVYKLYARLNYGF